MTEFACLSVNGGALPLDVFEQLAFPRDELPIALKQLQADTGAEQLLVLSTCERTELYALGAGEATPAALLHALATHCQVSPSTLRAAVSRFVGADAVRHLLRVTAGLESFVLGETDIVGQVRAAGAASREAGTDGLRLDRLIASATHAARRVHRGTALGSGGRSVATAAVQVAAAQHGGTLAGRSVVVVGAGHVAATVAGAAGALGARVTVCNRTRRHADRLVAAGATAVDLAALDSVIGTADVLIFGTAAPHRLLEAAQLRSARRTTADDLLVLDLCVPRNVDPAVRDLPGVRLLDLTDLRDAGLPESGTLSTDVIRAGEVVQEEVTRYLRWLSDRSVATSVQQLRSDVERYAQQELEHLPAWIEPDVQALVEQRVRRVVRRLAHRPTQRLLEAAASGDDETVRVLADLFADQPALGGRAPLG